MCLSSQARRTPSTGQCGQLHRQASTQQNTRPSKHQARHHGCMFELDYSLDAAYGYVQSQHGSMCRVQGAAGFCMRRNGQPVAGAVFYDFNGRCIWVHTAGSPGGHWLNRKFLHAYLAYPFVVCGVSCLRGFVHARNERMLKLIAHLGGVVEATLPGAAADGEDMVIAALWKDKLTYGPLA